MDMGARKFRGQKVEGVKIKGTQNLRELRYMDFISFFLELFISSALLNAKIY